MARKKLPEPFSTHDQIDVSLRMGLISDQQAEALREALNRSTPQPARGKAPHSTAASSHINAMQYVYAVDRTRAVEQVESLINDRVRRGWEFVTAYASAGGVGATFGTNVLIFRKKK